MVPTLCMNKIFDYFVGEAALFRKAKAIHEHILSVDSHTDAPLRFVRNQGALGMRGTNRVNIPKMQEGMVDAQFFAAWVGSDTTINSNGKKQDVALPLTDHTFSKAWRRTLQLIDVTMEQIRENEQLCGLARSASDVAQLKAQGKKAIFLAVENGLGIGYSQDYTFTQAGSVSTTTQDGKKYVQLVMANGYATVVVDTEPACVKV